MKAHKRPLVYDPGWITQAAQERISGKPIIDIRAHLRGVGVVQPPLKYPNQKPREEYSNPRKLEGTSPGILVTTIDGANTVKHHSEYHKSRSGYTRTRKQAQAYKPSLISTLPAIGNIE